MFLLLVLIYYGFLGQKEHCLWMIENWDFKSAHEVSIVLMAPNLFHTADVSGIADEPGFAIDEYTDDMQITTSSATCTISHLVDCMDDEQPT